MSSVIMHTGQESLDLLGTGTLVLALGLVVFGVVIYDLYLHWSSPGGEEWQ